MKYDLNQYLKVTVESVDPRNFRGEFETEDTLTENNNNNNNYNMHISKFSITMQDPRLPDFFQVMVQTTCEK